MTPVLSVDQLTVSYGRVPALCGVGLDMAAGDRVAIVGASGCGKSTWLRAIAGLLGSGTRVGGSIRLLGEELTTMPPRRRRSLAGTRIGYVGQDPYRSYDPLRTVRHHVEEPVRIQGRRPAPGEITQQLHEVGIPDAGRRLRHYPHQWSGGMLQRATITAGTALDPVLTLADEPTSALDADLADPVMHALSSRSRSLLVVTHDLALATRHAEHILVMHDGVVVESGPASTVLNTPQHERSRILVAAAHPAPRRAPSQLPSPEETAPVVEATGMSRSYQDGSQFRRAVHHASMTVSRGEIVGVVGASGSGKSTLLRLLAGIERPDTGTVTHGTDRTVLPRPGGVMPIFQDPTASLDARWPLWRTVTEPAAARATLSRRDRKAMTRRSLDQVELAAVPVGTHPRQLSTGQAQRVAVARALAAAPDLVVADEPTASLDVNTARAVMSLLRQVSDSRGVAQVLVTHNLELIESVADRILTMQDGHLDVRYPTEVGA